MRIFSTLYTKVIELAGKRHARHYLAAVSFAEASFSPVPADLMLAPMILANPLHTYNYAKIATCFAVLGGMFGYIFGYFAFEPLVEPLIQLFGYTASYLRVVELFDKWGFWLLCAVGCIPLPYKFFTISAGMLHYHFGFFVVASIIGRSLRYFLVSAIIKFGGPKIDILLRRVIDRVGYMLVVAILVAICLHLLGCGIQAPAQIVRLTTGRTTAVYIVKPNDTIHSIARDQKVDHRYLVSINRLSPPYVIHIGQRLLLRGGGQQPQAANTMVAVPKQSFVPKPQVQPPNKQSKPAQASKVAAVSKQTTAAARQATTPNRNIVPAAPISAKKLTWQWPAQGPILAKFTTGASKKNGINIGGKEGSPIKAVAAGKVVYSGNGLRGYGNLIILKHDNNFLSAYAHNSKNIVPEGATIKAGQIIAEMGKTGTNKVMLHFEIRHNGSPVDPEQILPRK